MHPTRIPNSKCPTLSVSCTFQTNSALIMACRQMNSDSFLLHLASLSGIVVFFFWQIFTVLLSDYYYHACCLVKATFSPKYTWMYLKNPWIMLIHILRVTRRWNIYHSYYVSCICLHKLGTTCSHVRWVILSRVQNVLDMFVTWTGSKVRQT